MKKNFCGILTLIAFLQASPNTACAKLIQILHTNDTHSYLEYSTHDRSRGGSARLKSLIDFYKSKMAEENIKTITMDAGDFTEGNLFYMADQGRKVFEVHNEMGYDVGTIGNHDYLMGTKDLDKILGEFDLKMSFVAANLEMVFDYKNIKSKITPYKEIEIDGIKIAVLGLTTDEIFYKWRLEGGVVSDPFKVAQRYEEILKDRKNDFIIALTHIGVLNDIKLAEKTKSIDLIVGGHSHTALFKPSYGTNKNNLAVPIVQAGMHTEYLGRLLIDVEKGKPLKIVQYELVPVKNESTDLNIKSMVKEANNDLNITYGKDWLDEKIGYSDLKADDKEGSLKWSYFITDAMKAKVNVDVAIHTPFMNGENFPVGNITRRDLFNSIPRVFDLTEKYGWSIYTTQIKGIWLKSVFEALTHFGQPLTFSGIEVEFDKTERGAVIKNIKINGEEVVASKNYTVAFTEGIIKGAQGISPYTQSIMGNPKNTTQKIWMTLEEKIIQCSKGFTLNKMRKENHLLINPNAGLIQ
ncbi:MAG: bifunctional UDP-sugar hydrolase/5'-nucleotidase [Bacteriovorax sp.]|nr:bifunctional UDP-sugar hydrolase/5'-nucleotidase [Bacteriovorax sp.]